MKRNGVGWIFFKTITFRCGNNPNLGLWWFPQWNVMVLKNSKTTPNLAKKKRGGVWKSSNTSAESLELFESLMCLLFLLNLERFFEITPAAPPGVPRGRHHGQNETKCFLKKVGYNPQETPCVPITGWYGDNMLEKSNKMSWESIEIHENL